ncbi:TetR family transcriptional regulator [Murinocardiopsis flavida]|uniref:TetR family transcriptional regulator n=1 Tax=Murinocardiopsis flavida TaxID=645275 RepID=A0A2P8DPF1_9ACTN|nr:TetR/AcrR family transcriptional regulator [Murinocardiopsis flavida]PSK99080.1 TetR family transcriptional regulator [Murinocardiopsis flavida]
MVPRKVDRQARRAEILAAAVRVFARRGFADSRIEDVASEAGVAKGSVYLYFESREALLHGAFDALSAHSAEILRDAVHGPGADGHGTAPDRLAALVRSVLGMLTAQPDIAHVVLDLWAAGRGRADMPLDLARTYREYRAAITTLLEQARDEGWTADAPPQEHAAIIVGAIEGCLLQWLMDPKVDPAALADPLVRMLVPGATAAAADSGTGHAGAADMGTGDTGTAGSGTANTGTGDTGTGEGS